MYTNDGEVTDNVSIGNTVGYAVMYSHRLTIRGNVSDGDRDRGFLFNLPTARGSRATWSSVGSNQSSAGRPRACTRRRPSTGCPQSVSRKPRSWRRAPARPGKCVFIYNTNQNRFRDNWFEGCEIGIHFTAGSEGNEIVGNAFVKNQSQVKYVGTRYLDWSKGGRGNYWSDNPAFDLNGDGLGDSAYRPNDLMDKVLWTAPQAKVLANSPAVQVIRWAQTQFPALLPGGVVDSHPLMAPPARPKVAQEPAMTGTVKILKVVKRFGQGGGRPRRLVRPAGRRDVALVGHNGAGKTTLMKLMLGLIRPMSGSIRVLGEDPAAGEFAARRRLGYLPENVCSTPPSRAARPGVLRSPETRGRGTVSPLLDRVGLGHAADRRVGTYSKGMRQRLGLAQALLGEPRVLLLDEPTTGMDPALRQASTRSSRSCAGAARRSCSPRMPSRSWRNAPDGW